MEFDDWVAQEWRPMRKQVEAITDALFGAVDTTGVRRSDTEGLIRELQALQAYEQKEHTALRVLLWCLGLIFPGTLVLAKMIGLI